MSRRMTLWMVFVMSIHVYAVFEFAINNWQAGPFPEMVNSAHPAGPKPQER